LFALDYEKDEYDTPRIAGVLGPQPFVGIVRKDAVIVEAVAEPAIVATYEKDRPEPYDFRAETAEAAARGVYEADYEHPVVAAGVAKTDDGYAVAHTGGQ
jgi:IMP cyclohydrolase